MSWVILWAAALAFQVPTPPVPFDAMVKTPVPACNYQGQPLRTMSYTDLRCLALSGTIAGLTLVTAPSWEWIHFNPDTPDSNATW